MFIWVILWWHYGKVADTEEEGQLKKAGHLGMSLEYVCCPLTFSLTLHRLSSMRWDAWLHCMFHDALLYHLWPQEDTQKGNHDPRELKPWWKVYRFILQENHLLLNSYFRIYTWEVSAFGTVFFQFDWWVLSHSGPDSCLTGQWSSNSLLFSWCMTGEEWVDWTQGCWFQFHLILLVDKSQEGRIHWRFLEKMYFLIKDPQDEQAKWFPVSCSPNGSLNYMPRNRSKSFLKGFLKIWFNPCPFTGALTISV